jgi:hypothetical protein
MTRTRIDFTQQQRHNLQVTRKLAPYNDTQLARETTIKDTQLNLMRTCNNDK